MNAQPVRSYAPRAVGAAVTGALLASAASVFLTWTEHHSEAACGATDGLCFTWWDVAAIPLTCAVALIVLAVVYKRLDIGPRFVVIPPTILLAPVPLAAAHAIAGWWAAAVAGGVWSCSLVLALRDRWRVLGLTAAAVLLLGSLAVLYG
ncbi:MULTISPECIES: hypothetical protein [unclassified Streptomyces]|uniref:hypothetical protein n=1 Tax=unclassified Streptomyces TaxID=2593676 RepID=UPI000DD54E61|nr:MULTISPECIES: hypothetical protein [unclassified Streptomyces]QZZ28940.1 hypothetical protein A7X85_24175 [Streptomyces sp. ST1015]